MPWNSDNPFFLHPSKFDRWTSRHNYINKMIFIATRTTKEEGYHSIHQPIWHNNLHNMHLQILPVRRLIQQQCSKNAPLTFFGSCTMAACLCPSPSLMHFPSALMCMSCCLPNMTEMAQCPKTLRCIPMAINWVPARHLVPDWWHN